MYKFNDGDRKRLRQILNEPLLKQAVDNVLQDTPLPSASPEISKSSMEELALTASFLGGTSSAFKRLYKQAGSDQGPQGPKQKKLRV